MTDSSPLDSEKLALLLEGRLSDVEAAAVRRALSTAEPDLLDAFADAIAIHREIAPASETSLVSVAASSGKRATSGARLWMSLATLAAAAVVGILVLRRASSDSASSPYLPAVLVADLPRSSQTLAPAWSVTRGGIDAVSARGRAVRLGALFVDLELTIARDRGDGRAPARAAAALLEDVQGGALMAGRLQTFIMNPGAGLSRSELELVGRDVASLLDQSAERAGAYLEAARLSIATGDPSFLTRHPLPIADLTAVSTGAGEDAVQSLGRLTQLLNAGGAAPAVLQSSIEELILFLAR